MFDSIEAFQVLTVTMIKLVRQSQLSTYALPNEVNCANYKMFYLGLNNQLSDLPLLPRISHESLISYEKSSLLFRQRFVNDFLYQEHC